MPYFSNPNFFRMNLPAAMKRIVKLFQGHHDLIVGFECFLPAGYKIKVCPQTIDLKASRFDFFFVYTILYTSHNLYLF